MKTNILILLSCIIVNCVQCYSQCFTDIDFNTWTQTGNPSYGKWVVSGNGNQVTQTINPTFSAPTFFISPDTFINVIIQGSISTPAGDDDFVGFVFGYKQPIGNSTNYDCWLLDWKKQKQNIGYLAEEGLSLSKIKGNISDNTKYFWGHTNDAIFNVAGSDWGTGKGWEKGTTYQFTLLYTTTRIIIKIDGKTIFDISGCFEPGHFGFYNNSQSNVVYADFNYQFQTDFSFTPPVSCNNDPVYFQFADSSCTNGVNTSSTIASWLWNFGDGNTSTETNPTHNYSNAGTYTVELVATDKLGCKDTVVKEVTVFVNTDEIAAITPVNPLCMQDTTVLLKASPDGGIWSGTGITDSINGVFNPQTAGTGTHTIIYIISEACGNTDTANIIVNNTADATIYPVNPLCENELAITLSAAAKNGIWTGTGITDNSNGTFNPSIAGSGTHTITYTISGVCGNSDTAKIIVNSNSDATITPIGALCANEKPVNLKAVSSGGIWTGTGITNSTTGTFAPAVADTGIHIITYSINSTCGDTDEIEITVKACANSKLWVPNVFTPNGDGVNDIFPKGDGINDDFYAVGQNIICYHLQIFNRWGEKLFETEEFSATWDGTYKSSLVPDGVYVWLINYCGYEDGNIVNKDLIGHVTVLK